MSEDETIRPGQHEDETDVEAHKKGAAANEEAPAEGESDDDFEAHRAQKNMTRRT